MARIVPLSSNFAKVEVSSDGTTWEKLENVSSYEESGGEKATDTTTVFDGSATAVGQPAAVSIAFEAVYLPHLPAWRKITDAYNDGESLSVRFTTQAKTVFGPSPAGSTVAIAATGACTFAGNGNADFTSEDYGPGMALVVGGKRYAITSISDSGAVKVVAPASAVAASVYSVEVPSVRRGPFRADLINADKFRASAGDNLTTTVTLQPTSTELPPLEIV